MEPLHAKMIAASSGATLTALTMTPFDVVKTRLQTQIPSNAPPSSSSVHSCLHQPHASCSRNISSMARRNITMAAYPSDSSRPSSASIFRGKVRPVPSEVCICLWQDGAVRATKVKGFWDGLFTVAKIEGLRGLWKGLGTTLLIAVPSQSAYMITYDHLLNKVMPAVSPYTPLTPLFAGIAARTAITSVMSPLELLRTTLQATPSNPLQPHNLRTVLASTRSLVRTDGIQALWRGLVPTLWRDVPFSGVYWAGYEAWKGFLTERTSLSTPVVAFASGAISGMSAAMMTHPFDVAKTRRQALVLSQAGVPTSTMPFLRQLVKNEGLGALYAGLSPRLAKIAPACGIMIASYETIGKFLTAKQEDQK